MTPRSPFFSVNVLTAFAVAGAALGVWPVTAVLVPYAVFAAAVVGALAVVGLAVYSGKTSLGTTAQVAQALTDLADAK